MKNSSDIEGQKLRIGELFVFIIKKTDANKMQELTNLIGFGWASYVKYREISNFF